MSAKVKDPVIKGVAKTPVVMQMEALECGAACLSMVLAYYDLWVPLEQLREDCGVSRDGSNARNVLKAARGYGLTAVGFKFEPEELRQNGQFPCIVHWEFNHFIVVNGFKGNKVYVNDPARGSITMSMEAFDEGFTGVCIMFEPGEDFKPAGKKKSIMSFARKRLTGAGSSIAFVAMTTVITAVSAIIAAGLSRVFLDQVLTGYDRNYLVPLLLCVAIITFIQIMSEWIQAIYALRINGKLAAVGSTSYFWQVMRLPMRFFSQRTIGDIEQRQETNESIASDLVNTIAPLVMDTFMMVFYLVVMVRYSLLLTAVGLASVFINLTVSKIISDKRVNITRVMMRDEGKLASATVSGISMIETIKSSGAENGWFEKWSGYQASVNTQNVRYIKLNNYLGVLPEAVLAVSNVLVLVIGVYLMMRGHFTAGMVVAFQTYLRSFTEPAMNFVTSGQTIMEMRSRMERIEDVMEYPVDPLLVNGNAATQADTDETFDKLSGALTMRGVTFGYSKLADPLIEGFDLELERGKKVAFVGPSGCGKSTLSKLITGLYQPWEGEILFDGKRIDEIDRSIFTGSVAVVDQEITLFEDTISNNIKMWDESIEDFEVIMAARDSMLHEDIMQRDGGYQYRITEEGRDFSGGQRQRMEIARVLAQDPRIIIMDEATSALDAKTEQDVVDSITERGITCIIIAHRLSTIRDCDEIIVLEKGKVVERGTHEELMKLNGSYVRLVMSEQD